MKTYITQKQSWKKIALAALTLSIAAPFATAVARADDDNDTSFYGSYEIGHEKPKKAKKNKHQVIRDRDNDGFDDRDHDRDGDLDEEDGYDYRETPAYDNQYNDDDEYSSDNRYNNGHDSNRNGVEDRYENEYRNGRTVTVTGTLVRDLPGNRFEMRASNGITYRVMTRNNEPLRLTRGDQVTVSGRVVGNNRIIVADRVRITRDDDRNQNGSRVNFTAVVTSIRSERELQVRSEAGRTYTVRTKDRFSSSIDRGDRVRVTGRLRSNVISESRVQLLHNNDWDNNNDNRTISFEGRVQSSGGSFGERIITVRADNGTTYRVRFNSNTRFDNGDRVRVSGRLRNGVVDASRVTLIDGNNNDGSSIDFRGRVESSRSLLGQRILTVRADNGTTYRVRYTGSERYDDGQRVRVRGDLQSGIVFANDIDRV